MEKKNLAIIVLAIALAASGVGNVILGVMTGFVQLAPEEKQTLVIGYGSNPAELDPLDTWDVPSHNMQHQVVEGLVKYDITTHPNYTIKPVLAESWEWISASEIKFNIRKGVRFHDGELCTAEEIKWNFERVQWFINASGDLPANETSWPAFPGSLYFFSDGTPIFKEFRADSTYEFTIVTTKPMSALLDLLCFSATYIMSPASTPRYTYLDLAEDILVGTGPYEYIRFERDKEIRLEVNEHYWGEKPYFEEVVMYIIEDDTARMTAGLAGVFDLVGGVPKSFIDTFKADDDFIVKDVGEDLCYWYLEIYCGPKDENGDWLETGSNKYQAQKNPAYLRRALAYAVNYSYIWEEIKAGYSVEGTTAVPRTMPGNNASVVQASDEKFDWEDNVEKARQLLKDNAADIVTRGGMNVSGFAVDKDSDWKGKNILGRKLALNRHFGSVTNLRLNQLMAANFDLLGIQTEETIRHWDPYLETGENTPWEMDIGYVGWCPDYLNPFNMIDPLFNLASGSCFSRINDTSPGGLTALMEAAAAETDRDTQLDLYRDIQSLIYDVERPLNPASHTHISGWSDLVQSTHKANLMKPYTTLSYTEYALFYWED